MLVFKLLFTFFNVHCSIVFTLYKKPRQALFFGVNGNLKLPAFSAVFKSPSPEIATYVRHDRQCKRTLKRASFLISDKRAFYLLSNTQNVPQIYELVASSTADRSQ
jgi:hypothetical protein